MLSSSVSVEFKQPFPAAIFLPSHNGMDARAQLDYFRSRRNVRYFPVLDAHEAARAKVDAMLQNTFEFVGESYVLNDPPNWITNPSVDVEWHILLHKFYYAVGMGMAFRETGDTRYVDKWIALTRSWIEQTDPGFIASDVTGRRIQNWIYAYHYFVDQQTQAEICPEFHRRFLASLHQQVDYLTANLHEARNHRTLELSAIFLAAVVFPEFAQAKHWLEFSLSEIEKNIESDLLPDNVHCELSTDYHHLVLRNYLNMRRLAKMNHIEVPRPIDELLEGALEFSMHVHRPDGKIPSLSDGDVHSYLDLLKHGYDLYGREDMLYVATQGVDGVAPSRRAMDFHDAGYYIVRSGWGDRGENYADERYLVFDCGPLGAGNHGHFDCLSLELYAYGHPLVVDPGRYTYHEDASDNWRVRFRGTAYHNTVVVDGKNQTRYEPGPKKYKVQGSPPAHELKLAMHRPGFDLLRGTAKSEEYDAVHERTIAFVLPEYWIVSDTLTAQTEHRYEQMFHLSAQAQDHVQVTCEAGTYQVLAPHLLIAQCDSADTLVAIDAGFVSERYGDKQPAPVVRFIRQAKNTTFYTVLYPYRDCIPQLRAWQVPVWCEEDPLFQGRALCIAVNDAGASFTDHVFFAPEGKRRTWRFGNYSLDGSYLALRKNAFGEIVRLHASPGAVVKESGYVVPMVGAPH